MGVSYGSGYTTATGTFFTTPSKHTVLPLIAERSTSGTTTSGTVPAGKVWRIIGISLVAAVDGAYPNLLQCLLNDVVCLQNRVTGVAANGNASYAAFVGTYSDAFVLTAGQTVKFTTTQAAYATMNVQYIEEAA